MEKTYKILVLQLLCSCLHLLLDISFKRTPNTDTVEATQRTLKNAVECMKML